LYLGRIGDTECEGHSLLIAAVNFTREAHSSWKNEVKKNPKMIFRMPIIVDGCDVSGDGEPDKQDVGPESFTFNESHSLKQAICRIHEARQKGEKVFVACAQGKDRSGLVVLAYLMVEYQVLDRQKVYDFVQNKRYILSTKEIPKYWEFLEEFTQKWNPKNFDQECEVVLGDISRSFEAVTREAPCVEVVTHEAPFDFDGRFYGPEYLIVHQGEYLEQIDHAGPEYLIVHQGECLEQIDHPEADDWWSYARCIERGTGSAHGIKSSQGWVPTFFFGRADS